VLGQGAEKKEVMMTKKAADYQAAGTGAVGQFGARGGWKGLKAGGGVAGDLIQNGSEALIKIANMFSDVTTYEDSFSGRRQRCRFNSCGPPDNLIGHGYMKNTNNKYRGITLSLVSNVRIQQSTDGGGTWSNVD
jgi:hypothetical protein